MDLGLAELETTITSSLPFCINLLSFFYLAHSLTFILNEKLQFISVTYMWSHGVDEKCQSGLQPAYPTATPMFSHTTPFGVATHSLTHSLTAVHITTKFAR